MDPLPTYIPPRESAQSNAALASRYPLAIICRRTGTSQFVLANMPSRLRSQEPGLEIHPGTLPPGDSERRAVRIFNDRGSSPQGARQRQGARRSRSGALGVVEKAHRDRRNAMS